jgi:hypothetical protein
MVMTSEPWKQRGEEVDDRARRMRHAEKVDGETRDGHDGEG